MPDSSRPSRTTLVILAILVSGAVGLGVWYLNRSDPPPPPQSEVFDPDAPTPDPRIVFETPYRNVKPEVGYVGDEVCARCHLSITKSYHAHPMGRSADTVSGSTPVERYDPSGRTEFTSGQFDLEVLKTEKEVRHITRLRGNDPARVPELNLRADIALGSGTRGRSYLAVEGGTVWQTAASWYGPDEKWDVSPGFRLGKTARRAIGPECLYCHVDNVRPVPGADNRYHEPVFPRQVAIGCERCHGPGELHVAERSGGGVPNGADTSIVNPKHLAPALRTAICEQCHLQGEQRVNRRGRDAFEYRPGLPFEQFVSVYVRHPAIAESHKSVGQFEQMEQSRCFTGSSGRLGCTSCHDPHSVPQPAARDAHYRARCLTCHESRGCTAPQESRRERADSCVGCHMPKAASSNIIHTSVTDHRVPRKPTTRPATGELPHGATPIVRFRSGPFSPTPEECGRDLAIALARFATYKSPKGVAPGAEVRLLAVGKLRESLIRWPGDAEAWVALATAQNDRNELAERLRAARAGVALAPHYEAALAALTDAAVPASEFDLAEQTATEWMRLNPHGFDPIVSRAFVRLARGDWDRAEADALAALRLQPLHPEARLYLAICLHNKGDRIGAQRELQTATRLESDPREQQYLLDWFRRATR